MELLLLMTRIIVLTNSGEVMEKYDLQLILLLTRINNILSMFCLHCCNCINDALYLPQMSNTIEQWSRLGNLAEINGPSLRVRLKYASLYVELCFKDSSAG